MAEGQGEVILHSDSANSTSVPTGKLASLDIQQHDLFFCLVVNIVPVNPTVSSQLVDPRSVYKHYNPFDLVSLAQQVT